MVPSSQEGTYSVGTEDANNLVPFVTLIWLPAKLFGQAPGKAVDSVLHLESGVGLACDAAGEGIPRLPEGKPAIILRKDEVAYRN